MKKNEKIGINKDECKKGKNKNNKSFKNKVEKSFWQCNEKTGRETQRTKKKGEVLELCRSGSSNVSVYKMDEGGSGTLELVEYCLLDDLCWGDSCTGQVSDVHRSDLNGIASFLKVRSLCRPH